MKKKYIAAVVVGLLSSTSAFATLIAKDLNSVGDALLTADSQTGLEWLDVPLTKGRSFDDVTAGFGGWMASGFRYASIAEVQGLFQSAGLPSIPTEGGMYGYVDPQHRAYSLVELLGATAANGVATADNQFPQLYLYGITGDAYKPTSDSPTSQRYATLSPSDGSFYAALSGTIHGDSRDNLVGSFLVRQTAPVPEPETYAMMLAGLAVVGVGMKRKLSQ